MTLNLTQRDITHGSVRTSGYPRVYDLLNHYKFESPKWGKRIAWIAARAYLVDLRKFIMKYAGPNSSRSPATLLIYGSSKRRVGPLRQTDSYVKGLRVKKVDETKTTVAYRIGAHKDDTHRPSGLRMDVLARILEFGAPSNLVYGRAPGPIPARPHHGPAFKQFKKAKMFQIVKENLEKLNRGYWR